MPRKPGLYPLCCSPPAQTTKIMEGFCKQIVEEKTEYKFLYVTSTPRAFVKRLRRRPKAAITGSIPVCAHAGVFLHGKLTAQRSSITRHSSSVIIRQASQIKAQRTTFDQIPGQRLRGGHVAAGQPPGRGKAKRIIQLNSDRKTVTRGRPRAGPTYSKHSVNFHERRTADWMIRL